MKSYLLIPFFLLVILGKLFGQSANWVFELEGEEESNISHVVQNGVGDYFVLGQCSGGSTNFGDIVFETLTNARTFFVAKITGSGELEWVKPIENSGASGNWDGEVAGFVQSEQDGSLYFLFECNDVNGDVYGGGEFGSFVLIKLLNTGELDWVEEFESNHLYKNYGVGINALRVNEIGNLEVSIFSPKNEQIHMVKNNLWLPENSSVHLEFSPSPFYQALTPMVFPFLTELGSLSGLDSSKYGAEVEGKSVTLGFPYVYERTLVLQPILPTPETFSVGSQHFRSHLSLCSLTLVFDLL